MVKQLSKASFQKTQNKAKAMNQVTLEIWPSQFLRDSSGHGCLFCQLPDPVLKNTWQGLMTFSWENRDTPTTQTQPHAEADSGLAHHFQSKRIPLDFKQVGWDVDASILIALL